MSFKGFGQKVQQKGKKRQQLEIRFTTDGTPFELEDIPESGVIMFFDKIMFFPEGILSGKTYYPTSIEGTILYPSVPYSTWSKICTSYGVKMPETAAIGLDEEALGFWEWVHQECLPITLLDCYWEVLRLVSKDILAAYCVPFTNRPRESRDFK